MAKIVSWGPSIGMVTTPLCITPQLGVKNAYLSEEPLSNWTRKIQYEYSPAAAQGLLNDLVKLTEGNLATFVNVRKIVPEEVIEFLTEAIKNKKTVYVTVPVLNAPVRKYASYIFVQSPYTLLITKCLFGNLYAMHFMTGTQVVDLLNSNCECFVVLKEQFKFVIDNKEVSPCALCKYNKDRINNFCYLYNYGYSCLFHVGDVPEITTEFGGSQLASILAAAPDATSDTADNEKEPSMEAMAACAWESSEEEGES